MNLPHDDKPTVAIWQLTAEQRKQVYEEEKRRIAETGPMFSRATKRISVVYLFGCLVMCSGIPEAFINLFETHTWKLEPKTDLIELLFKAAGTLIAPFVFAWIVGMPLLCAFLFLPAMLIWGNEMWLWGTEIAISFKRLLYRDND